MISKCSRICWWWFKSFEDDDEEFKNYGCCCIVDDGGITSWGIALDFDRVATAPSSWIEKDLSFVNPNPYSESSNSSSYEIGCRER